MIAYKVDEQDLHDAAYEVGVVPRSDQTCNHHCPEHARMQAQNVMLMRNYVFWAVLLGVGLVYALGIGLLAHIIG